MKLKTVEVNGATYAEVKDGNPVVIEDDGQEAPFNIERSYAKIRELGAENRRFRSAKETAENSLRAFEGIENPDEAREALEFRRNAKDGEFIAAGKVEEMKAGLKRTFDEQHAATVRASAQRLQEVEGKLGEVTKAYNGEVIGNAFANSKFIRDKVAVPVGMIRSTFGGQFTLEDGKLVAHHADGSLIVATSGDAASFDEAIERIVNAYPDKDLILKGPGSSGSGARPSNGVNGKRTISRSDYDNMPPLQQRAFALEQAKGTAAIAD